MSNKVSFARGQSYLGTNADQPPNWSFEVRDPNTYDINYSIGDIWLNTVTQAKWVLTSLQGTATSKGSLATWVPWGALPGAGIVTVSGISNPATHVPGDGISNVQFTTAINNLTLTGDDVAHTITLAMTGTSNSIVTSLTDDNGVAVIPDQVTGVINMHSTIPNVQFLTGAPGTPNQMTLSFTGGPTGIVRSLSGTTGVPHATPVYPTAGGDIACRSAITGLTIVETANTLTWTSAGGGQYAEWITADAGTNPVGPNLAGNWFVEGGNNITTTGTAATNTVTIDVTGTTNHCLQVGNATGSLTSLAAATNGQVPIGSTGADPVLATLTAGAGINIANAAGSITISATAAPVTFTWTKVAVPTVMVAHNGYIANAAGILVFTLPAAAAIGDTFAVTGSQLTPNGWRIAQNAGQRIFFLDLLTTIGVGGYIQSDNQFETVWLVCITDTPGAERFMVVSSMGNITVV